MIEKFVSNLTLQMTDEEIINVSSREEYIYVITILIEEIITMVSLMVIGIIFRLWIPTLLFEIFFFSLRKRTGGFHADSFLKCYLMTIAIYSLIIMSIPFLIDNITYVYIALAAAIVMIWMIGAVNHPNMDMDDMEFAEVRKSARILVTLEGMCVGMAVLAGLSPICIGFMSIAIILCSISLCIAKILKQEVK